MNPSKESTGEAAERLGRVVGLLPPSKQLRCREDITFLTEFLAACERKLPAEDSFTAQKNRKRRFNPPLPPKEEE